MSETLPDFRLPDVLPTELPVLALLRGALLPGSIQPFNVGRAASVAALDAATDGLLLVVPQRNEAREPGADDLETIGVIARVLRNDKRNGGRFLLAQGLARVTLDGVTALHPHLRARFAPVRERWPETPAADALAASFRDLVTDAASMLGEKGRAKALLDQLPLLLQLDAVGAMLDVEGLRDELLKDLDPVHRAERVLVELTKAREVLAARQRIDQRVREEVRDKQREAVLRQQLDAIRKELGDDESNEADALRARVAALDLPDEVRESVDKELRRLDKVNPASPERQVIVDWVTRVADLPWNTWSADDLDFDRLEEALDASHTGLDDVKQQVLEHLSVRKLEGTGRADVLLLVGPPGVGKTSIAEAIADATGRRLVRVALGGVRDEAELRGHRRTYVGARPGRLIEGLRRAGTADPVVLLDEVDKVGRGVLGDPSAALLEILDPEQNHAFVDHYLEVPFDLSRALFIATANDPSTIPGPLLDRMEILHISGYTPAEKLIIARRHLLDKAAQAAGLAPADVDLDDATVEAIIEGWTREAGVRQLQRTLGRLYRAAAVRKARGTLDGPLVVREADLAGFLKRRRFHRHPVEPHGRAGIANGLAWTPVGGDVLIVEATRLPGKGGLVLTGQLGDVMKESARAALTYALSHADALGIDAGKAAAEDIHIHVPAGAVPKDGPSAGVTMFTSLVSLLSDRPVRGDTAMTGEATLRGRVLPVGGIKDKVLAAHQRGLRRVIVPSRNEPDLEDVPAEVRAALDIVLVDHMDDVLAAALDDGRPLTSRDAPATGIVHA